MDPLLFIEVHSYKDQALAAAIRAQFGAAGGTIGRSPDSTLLLPDPEKIISRTHATIARREGLFAIRDQGTTVPLIVNGRGIGRGREVQLAHGDVLRIAGYAMSVELTAAPTPDAGEGDAEETTILREGATLLSWSEGGVPVAEGHIETVFVRGPEGDRAMPSARRPAPPANDAMVPRAARPGRAPGTKNPADELLAALLRGAGVESLTLTGNLTPPQMEEIGAVMREMMRGLLDLLAARANAKREVHAEATMIGAQDNNPLKFSPSLEAAIAQFLVPKGQGFMAPLRAVTDACEGLRAHQTGFVAGMRAALESVLARFDPAKLEQRLPSASIADSLIPMNQKAKLWALYEEVYGEIAREAQGDFNALLGEEFLRAYTATARTSPPAGSAG